MIGASGDFHVAPGHVVAAVAAAILGRTFGHHWLQPAVKIDAVAAHHEGGLNALALFGKVAGGETNEQVRRALIGLHGIGVEMLGVDSLLVVQEHGLGPVNEIL